MHAKCQPSEQLEERTCSPDGECHSIHHTAGRAPGTSEGGRQIPPATQHRLASEQRPGGWLGPSELQDLLSPEALRLLWGLASLFRPVPTPMDVVGAWWKVWPGSPAQHLGWALPSQGPLGCFWLQSLVSWQSLRLGRPGPVTQQPGMSFPSSRDSGQWRLRVVSVISVCLPLPTNCIFSHALVLC